MYVPSHHKVKYKAALSGIAYDLVDSESKLQEYVCNTNDDHRKHVATYPLTLREVLQIKDATSLIYTCSLLFKYLTVVFKQLHYQYI